MDPEGGCPSIAKPPRLPRRGARDPRPARLPAARRRESGWCRASNGDQSRAAILDALRSRGGVHKGELCRLTGRGWGTIGHHVHVLERSGAVAREVHGRHLWIFLPDLVRAERDRLVATRTPQSRRLLEFIRRCPPMTVNSLSAEMDLSKKVIRTHLQHLQRYGAVTGTGDYPPKYTSVENGWDPGEEARALAKRADRP